jgi:hypothetical protein
MLPNGLIRGVLARLHVTSVVRDDFGFTHGGGFRILPHFPSPRILDLCGSVTNPVIQQVAGPVPQPPLAQEGLAALGDLGRLVHVFVVLEMNARRGFDSSVN